MAKKRMYWPLKLIALRYFLSLTLSLIALLNYISIIFPSLSLLKFELGYIAKLSLQLFGPFANILRDILDANALYIIQSDSSLSITAFLFCILLYIFLDYLVAIGMFEAENWARLVAIIVSTISIIINLQKAIVEALSLKNFIIMAGIIIVALGTLGLLYALNNLKSKKHKLPLIISSAALILAAIIIADYNAAYLESIALIISISIAYYLLFNVDAKKYFSLS